MIVSCHEKMLQNVLSLFAGFDVGCFKEEYVNIVYCGQEAVAKLIEVLSTKGVEEVICM